MDDKTRNFVLQHRTDDVRQLALKGGEEGIDMPFVLDQIRGWQVARNKIPSWATLDDIIYPPHLSMEQCSSETTALYKASLTGEGTRYIDLTGGMGVDFSFMARPFRERVYVERNAELCHIAEQNFRTLGLDATVVNADAESYLQEISATDVVFLDPARRDSHGGRTYAINDCTPDVLQLLPMLKQKARRIILKLSPMLDWHKALDDLGTTVSEVHIVSVGNECKELLFVLGRAVTEEVRLFCINDEQRFEVTLEHSNPRYPSNPRTSRKPRTSRPSPPSYLYEPNASIMKAGCFGQLSEHYGIEAISPNSHLFLADCLIEDFPGRAFSIIAISPMSKQALRQNLQGIKQANIAVRNFPESVATLRKRLKIADGGDTFIFATTLGNGEHRLVVCKKEQGARRGKI